jgi:hypothetical protein
MSETRSHGGRHSNRPSIFRRSRHLRSGRCRATRAAAGGSRPVPPPASPPGAVSRESPQAQATASSELRREKQREKRRGIATDQRLRRSPAEGGEVRTGGTRRADKYHRETGTRAAEAHCRGASSPPSITARNGEFIAISRSIIPTIVTLCSSMEADRCRTLLVDASTLIMATRSCIARSMTLLGQLTLDGSSAAARELPQAPRAPRRSSSHPPSAPPL